MAGRFGLLLPLLLIAAGCGSGPPPATRGTPTRWNIKLIKNPSAGSVQVDLVGVNKYDEADWKHLKMTNYWKLGNQMRKDAFDGKRAINTKFEGSNVFVLDRNDPIWKVWRSNGAFELMVLADLTGKYPDDESDPRRKQVPLGSKEFKGNTIEIEILENQIHMVTPPKD